RHTRSKRDWSSDVCSSDLPNTSTQITIQYENAKHDLREFKKSLDALDLLHPSGELRIIDLETDKPFIVANVELPELTERQVRSRSEERRVGKESRWWVVAG